MNINKILADIYEVDENLRQHDAKLRKLIGHMLQSRPQINIDKSFEGKLREDLLTYARTLNQKNFNFNFHPMKKFLYALGGVALAALVITPLVYEPSRSVQPTGEVDFNLNNITMTEDGDDFDLNFDGVDTGNVQADIEYAENAVALEAGYGGVDAGSRITKSSIYYGGDYAYKYVGQAVELNDSQLPVLKMQDVTQTILASDVISSLDLDLLDLAKFSDLNLQNISLCENHDNGYQIYIDLQNNTVNIYQNWEKWDYEAKDDYAIEPDEVKEADLIRIANDFVHKYGINMENYGEPEITEDIDIILERGEWRDTYTVIYPLLIDGKKIVSNWGSVEGISINVDLQMGEVSSAYGIALQKYQGKNYDTTQDFEAILDYVEGLGYTKLSFEDEADVQTAEIQTPEVVWLEYNSYNGEETINYLVPALSFEVEYPEEEYWWGQDNIVVPLIEDMFEQYINE